MILVTGGLGFIGSHTVRALLDLGAECVLVQRRDAGVPTELADEPVAVAQADITDRESLLAVGEQHKISGIVHLAGSMPWPPTGEAPAAAARRALGGLFNLVEAAQAWGVRRVGVASTIGVYAGAPGPLHEEAPLPMSSFHVIPTFKKIGELLTAHLAAETGLELVNLRIGGIWGPRGHVADPFMPVSRLVHAAARGTEPELPNPAFAEDGLDLCYVKDCARAIALLQLTETLRHRTYNVSSGRITTNGEIVAALKTAVPDARVDLPTGGSGGAGITEPLDITRLTGDTGYRPEYGTERAVADYLAWLRAGNAA
ncbi:UDP-glucose 4-epimerase [Crossiella equi]|uniref:UDP-glucose 4-epimerase n=1 Tax=Crossiella equi TaxID=130796 RepID=A0ABS5AR23_9PSEU|nr:NAD(P)-dependent oxidoreductase [Crossiella equi]MBP2479000.1 UDP-glucose 4-epimerase [Crossiella equi]